MTISYIGESSSHPVILSATAPTLATNPDMALGWLWSETDVAANLYKLTSLSPVTWTALTSATGEANTASNVGAAGVGIFKQKTGVDLEFKKLNAASTKITVADDVANSEVDIDVAEAQLSLANLGTRTHASLSDNPAASETLAGHAEIATVAEVDAGADNTRIVSPDGLAGSKLGKRVVTLIILDDLTNNAVGDGQGDITFTVPQELNGYNLVAAHAAVEVAGTTGTETIQIHNVTKAADMLSTRITIDSGELTSYTAATAPVVDTLNDDVATGDKLRVDTDAIHTTAAKGLQAILTFQLP